MSHVTRIFKVKRSKVNLQGAGHIMAASHAACDAYTGKGCLPGTHAVSHSHRPSQRLIKLLPGRF